jgi:hypothetical protein
MHVETARVQHIVKTPGICGGRACIAGHRVRVAGSDRAAHLKNRSRDFLLSDLRAAAIPLAVCFIAVSAATAFTDERTSSVVIYDIDPQHLWNRLHHALFVRIGPDRKLYGEDSLEPLLWNKTRHLQDNSAASDRAVAVLNEFIQMHGENLFSDPLKRAVLQRDLWMVFNWLQTGRDRQNLQAPLASVIGRLELDAEQLKQLPDNYAAAVASGEFAKSYGEESSNKPYLPPDLFAPDGPWVCVGRSDGPIALGHIREDLRSYANSTFLVMLRLPGGRAATLEFVRNLRRYADQFLVDPKNAGKLSDFPPGTEVALIRQALLIGAMHTLVASPLTESIQFRLFGREASFREVRLSRSLLFANRAGGLRSLGNDEQDFKTGFLSPPYDVLERRSDQGGLVTPSRIGILTNCRACHPYSTTNSSSFNSFFNYNGTTTSGDDTRYPVPLMALSLSDARETTLQWKRSRANWTTLHTLLVK